MLPGTRPRTCRQVVRGIAARAGSEHAPTRFRNRERGREQGRQLRRRVHPEAEHHEPDRQHHRSRSKNGGGPALEHGRRLLPPLFPACGGMRPHRDSSHALSPRRGCHTRRRSACRRRRRGSLADVPDVDRPLRPRVSRLEDEHRARCRDHRHRQAGDEDPDSTLVPDGLRVPPARGAAPRPRPACSVAGTTRTIVFAKRGVYKLLARNIQSSDQLGLETLGDDNVLTLTIRVR